MSKNKKTKPSQENKNLLSESQVRRFMGLAGIRPINELESHYLTDTLNEQDEDELEIEDEIDMDDEGEELDVEDEMDVEEEAPPADDAEAMVMSLLDAVAGWAEGQGVEMDIEGGDDAEPVEDEIEMEDEVDLGDEGEDVDGEEEIMEDLSGVTLQLTEEEIINEVARRVTKRILSAKKAHDKMNEALGRKTKK